MPQASYRAGRHDELIASLPEERRTDAILVSLGKFEGERVAAGLRFLDKYPSRKLAEVVSETARSPHSTYKLTAFRREMAALVKRHPELGASLPEPAAPTLKVTRVLRPTSPSELSAFEQEQLVLAGKGYDGRKLAAAVRLSTASEHEEESFAGSLEIRDVVNAEGEPAYTVFLYRDDSGCVYRAATSKKVASIAQFDLMCEDLALREALQPVVDKDPPRATATKSKPQKTTAKKASSKESSAKKAPAKKASSKEPPAKKAPAKKASAKKSSS